MHGHCDEPDTDRKYDTSQRPLYRQEEVAAAVTSVSQTNRDPHLLFAQVGEKLGFVPEATIRGAFLAIWVQENECSVDKLIRPIQQALGKYES